MKQHEREQVVREVELKLGKHLVDTLMETDLTYGEQLRVLTEVYGNFLARMAKYMIREERHGDPNKCGGLAYDEPKEEKKEFDVEGFLKDSDPPPAGEKP